MASGDTKTEAMLNVLGNGGSGDEFRGCCNTKTQQYILDAIDRVQGVEDEVEELKNNPDVVDIVDTYADLEAYDTSHLTDNDVIRVLADETHGGNSTYYRFTKNPDTWTFIGEISSGGGGITKLTTADYNFHYSGTTDDGLAWWLLDDGDYLASPSMKVYYQAYVFTDLTVGATGMVFTIMTDSSGNKIMLVYGEYKIDKLYAASNSDPSVLYPSYITLHNIITSYDLAQTTGNSTTKVMSQKAVTDALAGAGGGITELTSADYNYPETGTKTSVALWLLDDGIYVAPGTVLTRLSTSVNNGGSSWVIVKGTVASDRTSYMVYNGSSQAFQYHANPTNGSGQATIQRYFVDTGSLVSGTGTSTTSVMSQNATTSMVFADASSKTRVQIGDRASAGGNNSIAIGDEGVRPANASNVGSVAIGSNADSTGAGSIALGYFSQASQKGEMNIGSTSSSYGYNNSNYRLLTGLYDPQNAHDAATKGYVDTAVAGVGGGFTNGGTTAPTSATQGNVGDVYSYVDRSGSTPEPHLMVSNGDQTITTATAYLMNSLFNLTSNELVSPASLKSYVEQELGVTVTDIDVLIQEGDCTIRNSSNEASTMVPLSSLATNGLVLPQFVLDSTYTGIEISFYGAPVAAGGQMAVDGDLPVTNANTLLAFAEQKTGTTADFSQTNPYILLSNYNDADEEWDMYFPDDSASPVTVTNTELGANGFTVPTGMQTGEIQIDLVHTGGYQWIDVVNSVVENRLNGLTIVSISQTGYDNLQTKDPNTLYIITGA